MSPLFHPKPRDTQVNIYILLSLVLREGIGHTGAETNCIYLTPIPYKKYALKLNLLFYGVKAYHNVNPITKLAYSCQHYWSCQRVDASSNPFCNPFRYSSLNQFWISLIISIDSLLTLKVPNTFEQRGLGLSYE